MIEKVKSQIRDRAGSQRVVAVATLGFLYAVVVALVLGLVIPVSWQIPVIIVSIALPLLLIAVPFERMLARRRKVSMALSRNSSEQVDRLTLQRSRDNQAIASMVQEVSDSIKKLDDKLARLEGRAHTEEMRIRGVGQLAKKAADNSEALLARSLELQKIEDLANEEMARPESSVVVTALGPKPIGRLAAAVAPDPSRSAKLLRAMNYKRRVSGDGPLPIAVVGTPSLISYLWDNSYAPESLYPSLSEAQIRRSKASMLLIEGRAFSKGPWYGAEGPAGTTLFEEIRETCMLAKDRKIPVYFIDSLKRPNVYTTRLREMSSLVFPADEFDEGWMNGVNVGIMGELQQYALGEGNKND